MMGKDQHGDDSMQEQAFHKHNISHIGVKDPFDAPEHAEEGPCEGDAAENECHE